MWIIKKLFLGTLLLFYGSVEAKAKSSETQYLKQNIFFENQVPDWPISLTPSYPGAIPPGYEWTIFFQPIEKNAQKWEQLLNSFEDVEKVDMFRRTGELHGKKVDFNILWYKGKLNKKYIAKAFYFVYDKQNVGHLLVQRSLVVLRSSYYNSVAPQHKVIVQKLLSDIKKAPATKIVLPKSGKTLTIHKIKREGYIEIYGLIENHGDSYLVINGFVPCSLVTSYLKKAISFVDAMVNTGDWVFNGYK